MRPQHYASAFMPGYLSMRQGLSFVKTNLCLKRMSILYIERIVVNELQKRPIKRPRLQLPMVMGVLWVLDLVRLYALHRLS